MNTSGCNPLSFQDLSAYNACIDERMRRRTTPNNYFFFDEKRAEKVALILLLNFPDYLFNSYDRINSTVPVYLYIDFYMRIAVRELKNILWNLITERLTSKTCIL